MSATRAATTREPMQTSCNEQGPKPNVEQLMLLPPGEEDYTAAVPLTPMAAAVAAAKSQRERRYKQGPDPIQPLLLPPSIEDYVAADNPVRAIKAYVGTLDFKALQFKNAGGELKAGQPAFDPAALLGLHPQPGSLESASGSGMCAQPGGDLVAQRAASGLPHHCGFS